MASKEREYIDNQRHSYKSPLEQQKEVDALYGADAEWKMSDKEAHDIYDEAIYWAMWNDIPMQDYWAYRCDPSRLLNEDNPRLYVKKVLEALRTMSKHLARGKELGLGDLEQRVVDTLWAYVPHNYQENYVDCAREISKAIGRLLPPEDKERNRDGCVAYYNQVFEEIKLLAEKYDVAYSTSDYNLTVGYFNEWLKLEYGFINNDIFYEEE